MRKDMKNVVTERPRSGIRRKTPKGYNRTQQRYGEDSPKREKISLKWTAQQKEFTDVIGPLYRFLLKQVGRPWDKVYSEISQKLPKGTVTNNHIYTHVWQFVEKDVMLVGKEICYKGGRIHGIPVRSGRYEQLYIHPTTGILCKAKPGKDRYSYNWPVQEPLQPGIKVYPGCQYHKIKGVWYEVMVRQVTANDLPFSFSGIADVVLDRYWTNMDDLKKVYGGMYIGESKRRLSKKETKYLP